MANSEDPTRATEPTPSIWSSDDPVDPVATIDSGSDAPNGSPTTTAAARGTRRNVIIASVVAVLVLGGAVGTFVAARDHVGTTIETDRTSSDRPLPGDAPRDIDPDGDGWTGSDRPIPGEFDDHHEFGERRGPRGGHHDDHDVMGRDPDRRPAPSTTVPITGT